MNLAAPFIKRPVATTLLTIGVVLAGATSFFQLPVSPLPKIDRPVISVSAQLPGASPEVVATTATTPLERHLGVIADVDQMTSQSSANRGNITLSFELSRDIDGAARDVMAAISAAHADLPANLRSNPTYRKSNPNDAPILYLALTSKTKTPAQMYDQADSILGQRLSQISGVGQFNISGSALPAVRVELNPTALFRYGIGLEDVRAAVGNANAHGPQGEIEPGDLHYQVRVNDQATLASQYQDLIIAYRNGRAVRLSDVGEVIDSVEDLRNAGYANGERAISISITRQPAANIIETVDRVLGILPELRASIPKDINLLVTMDRSTSIRASLRDVELTLLIAVALVTLVVFAFLLDWRAALVPTVAVPISLIGTFSAMYALDFSLNNLSLMALTVATGFVVDDAIVMLENISRHLEQGMPRFRAAMVGAREVGFTIISMSLSLVAVFIPMLLMPGILGRMFWEFAMTLTVAVLISMFVSLTTTPMMCAFILRPMRYRKRGRFAKGIEWFLASLKDSYRGSLNFALDHKALTLAMLVLTIALNFYLFGKVSKGYFPQQDTGRLFGNIQADQATSFQSIHEKMLAYLAIIRADPAVDQVSGSIGGSQSNSSRLVITLKPPGQRPGDVSTNRVIARLRAKLSQVKGAQIFLQVMQEFNMGGRQANANTQYTLQADSVDLLNIWAPRLKDELERSPELTDVNSDQAQHGLESDLVIDRATASKLGIQVQQIDNTLYDAFGQRQVSTIYNALNQYHVVMEVAPQYWQHPESMKDIFISTSGKGVAGSAATNVIAGNVAAPAAGGAQNSAAQIRNQQANSVGATGRAGGSTASAVTTSAETMVPLSAIADFKTGSTPVSINHQGLFVSTTISFNLAPGASLSDAERVIHAAMDRIGMPNTVHGSFQGNAQQYRQSLSTIPLLFLAAIAAIYIVLGILYESYIHPLTILSTIPSAGVGALVALILTHGELNIIADIGIILLIGIVKKNAIMMIDFAIVAERNEGLTPRAAIEQACLLRFRPIMMTTMAALLGAVPLAVGFGEGSEMRQPLGIAIVGGLALSQILTLYTTPVVYLLLDRLRGRDPRLLIRQATALQLSPGQ